MNRLFWIVIAAIGAALILLIVNDSSGTTFGIENNDFARMVYLGAWALVLAPAILFSGMRLSDSARNLALWLLIALVLVAGYQYRYELQDFGNRVSAGLIPASPVSLVGEDGRAAVMLEKSPSGHFEVIGTVDGADIHFLVDTGATTILLREEDAARAGIDTEALAFDIPITTANGRSTAARTFVDTLSVGAITRNHVTVLVARAGLAPQSLLGMNFLGSLSGLDIRGSRLILRD